MVNAPVAAGNVVIETVVDCAPETTGFWAGARFDLLLLAAELCAGDFGAVVFAIILSLGPYIEGLRAYASSAQAKEAELV